MGPSNICQCHSLPAPAHIPSTLHTLHTAWTYPGHNQEVALHLLTLLIPSLWVECNGPALGTGAAISLADAVPYKARQRPRSQDLGQYFHNLLVNNFQ